MKKLLAIVIVALFASTACAQRNISEITAKDEVVIEFQHPATKPESKKYSIKRTDIPNAPPLPNAFQTIGDKGYLISTSTIDMGRPKVLFKVPVNNEADFKKVRILRLISNEIMSGGYEWKDCTLLPKEWPSPYLAKREKETKEFIEEYNQDNAEYLPNYPQRKVTCRFDEQLRKDEYFLVLLQTQPTPTDVFTELKLEVESEQKNPENNETTYKIVLKNTGSKNIGQLDFRSSFDPDTRLKEAIPSQGKCKKSDWGYRGTSTVCNIGSVAAGSSISVVFVGEASGFPGGSVSGKTNGGWDIIAFIKEHPADLNLWQNWFQFDPLRSQVGRLDQRQIN